MYKLRLLQPFLCLRGTYYAEPTGPIIVFVIVWLRLASVVVDRFEPSPVVVDLVQR